MTPLVLADLFAPVTDLSQGDGIEDWRWLVGSTAQPLLMTAMGDVFLHKPARLFRRQGVFFLETATAECRRVASTYEALRGLLSESDKSESWLLPHLVAALRESGQVLREGQCYSPKLLPALGGEFNAANFDATDWRVHLAITGQILEKLRKVPDGARVRFEAVE